MTHQTYIITLFDAQIDQKWERLHDEMWDSGKMVYIGSQLERCPESGRLHWQAFVKFHRQTKQRGTWFKKYANGIHFTVCSKERAEAINYGTKEETRVAGPKENGLKPEPVQKFDAEQCKALILAGKKEEIPFGYVLRYNLERRYDALREFLQADTRSDLPAFLPNPWGLLIPTDPQRSKKRHFWIYSRLPNKGKTYHFALPIVQKYQAEVFTGNMDYFNLTPRTQCIIFDEYNTARFKWDTLDVICDGTYSWRRFGQTNIRILGIIIVLSNAPLYELYPNMNQFLYERFIEKELL